MIICCGESLIDMISIANAGNESVFAGLTGGAIFNTSIALGRLDVPVGLISGVSTDLFGKKITNDLTDSNVNIKLLIRNEKPTTLAFVDVKDGQANYTFYDENSAGNSIHYSDFPNIPKIATTLCFGGISLCTEPAASAYEKLFIQEIKNKVLFLDPNIRSTFISDEISYRKRLNKMISSSDILKVSDEDLDWIVTSGSSINEKIEKLHNLGAKLIIVTKGAEGVAAYVKNKKVINLPAQKVNVIDTVGAGDTFNAGFLAKLSKLKLLSKSNIKNLSSKQISMALEYGIKAASITVSRKGANPPLLSEI
jgi:fructokinase